MSRSAVAGTVSAEQTRAQVPVSSLALGPFGRLVRPSVGSDGESEDDRSGDDHVARRELLLGCRIRHWRVTMPAVTFQAGLLRVDVIDVHDGTKAHASGLCVKLGLATRGRDGLLSCLRPQLGFGGNVEVDAVNLICSGSYQINRELL
jgi:hypothetical protein